jgi:hypothetical protein
METTSKNILKILLICLIVAGISGESVAGSAENKQSPRKESVKKVGFAASARYLINPYTGKQDIASDVLIELEGNPVIQKSPTKINFTGSVNVTSDGEGGVEAHITGGSGSTEWKDVKNKPTLLDPIKNLTDALDSKAEKTTLDAYKIKSAKDGRNTKITITDGTLQVDAEGGSEPYNIQGHVISSDSSIMVEPVAPDMIDLKLSADAQIIKDINQGLTQHGAAIVELTSKKADKTELANYKVKNAANGTNTTVEIDAGGVLRVNASSGGASKFEDLTDVTKFTGNKGKVPVVSQDEKKLEYTSINAKLESYQFKKIIKKGQTIRCDSKGALTDKRYSILVYEEMNEGIEDYTQMSVGSSSNAVNDYTVDMSPNYSTFNVKKIGGTDGVNVNILVIAMVLEPVNIPDSVPEFVVHFRYDNPDGNLCNIFVREADSGAGISLWRSEEHKEKIIDLVTPYIANTGKKIEAFIYDVTRQKTVAAKIIDGNDNEYKVGTK